MTIVPTERGRSARTSGKHAKEPPARIGILVLGMHRSGTSALTQVLSLLGATLPQNLLSSVENNNPAGFFESARLKVLHDRMLVEAASRWDDWRAFDPSVLDPERLAVYQAEIVRLLKEEYGDAPLLVLKDPRICRFVPFYEELLAGQGIEPRFILPHRNPLAVIASLAKRDGMTEGFAGLLWLRHILDAEKSTRGKRRAFLSYEALLGDWRGTIDRVTKALELTWPRGFDEAAAEIDAHLSRDLQHHRPTFADLETKGEIPGSIKESYVALQALAGTGGKSKEALTTLTRVRREFEAAVPVFGGAAFPELEAREGKLSAGLRRVTGELGQRDGQIEELTAQKEALEAGQLHVAGELRQRDGQIEELTAQKEALEAEQRRVAGELKQRDGQIEELAAQKEALEAEQLRVAGELRQRDGQIEELAAQKEALEAEQLRVAGKLRQWGGQIEVLTAQIAALEPDVGALREVLTATGAKLAASETAVSELSNQITTIHLSRSWRLLWPIRAVVNGLRQAPLYFGRAVDAHPLAGLKATATDGRFTEWTMTDDEPRFGLGWLNPHPLPPGLYRLSLEMSPDVEHLVQAKLYLNSGKGFREDQRIALHFQTAGKAKFATRIVLPRGATGLRLDPSGKPGKLSLGRIRIRRVGRLERYGELVARLSAGYVKNPFSGIRAVGRALKTLMGSGVHGLAAALRAAEIDLSTPPATLAPTTTRSASRPPGSAGVHRIEGRAARNAPVADKRPGSTHGLPGVDPGSEHAAALQATDGHIARARAVLETADVGRFSIVMPTWNRRQSVGSAIESVLAQSYEDWELIVCDDGSTDGTEEYVCERFASYLVSGQIRYLRLEHRGVSAARNAGLRAAHGRWIAYLDSDNAWHPHYLLLTAAGYASLRHRRTAYACVHVHDAVHQQDFIRCQPFDWSRLLSRNFIDLNVFSHHWDLYEQLAGFDESLTRLVDWDLILRYTQLYEPQFNPFVLCDYYVSYQLDNITLRESLETNETAVRRKFPTANARNGTTSLRLAYVLWDWPALSQTFVLEELRELRRRNVDVRVYYAVNPDRAAENLPDVVARRVTDAEELARLLVEDERNWIHSHFAYPAVTKLVWPASEKAGVAFSFMPHAVDIFNHANRERNRIVEVTSSPLCARVMVYGDHHRRFLTERGVPAEKIIMTPQAVDTAPIRAENVAVRTRTHGEPLRVLMIGRFIEKKGIEHLIEGAALLDRGSVEIGIYGFGPLEDRYRNLIEQQGLEATVRLRGVFEGADALRDALAWADVFCLPCVEAENGDVDGMPTVFFEAMAAGVPCIAGAVSAIPDFITDGITGFLVPQRDAAALAATLRRVAELPAETLTAIAQAARDWTDEHLGTRHTIDTLLDSSAHPPLDIFMVTYKRDGRGEWSATERAIRSVLERTTTPFVLTLVDNGSEEDFLDRLRAIVHGDDRVRLIELGANLMCGPASNIALQLARSPLVFYVCSNEGYVARPGWERPCLRYMRNRPHVAMGGRLVSSPSWPDGRGYMRQGWFADFRNPEFARCNPDREFFHVQGGLWVLRRDVFKAEGGFSERCPQAQTDVEYSYYLESCGYTLGNIPGLLVLSNKTRPGLNAFLDETVLAVHPIFDDVPGLFDASTNGGISRCNICSWSGQTHRKADGVSFDCPQCASTPRDRATFRWLAASNLHHRGLTLDARDLGQAACNGLQTMFRLLDEPAQVQLPDRLPGAPSRMLGIPPQLIALNSIEST